MLPVVLCGKKVSLFDIKPAVLLEYQRKFVILDTFGVYHEKHSQSNNTKFNYFI